MQKNDAVGQLTQKVEGHFEGLPVPAGDVRSQVLAGGREGGEVGKYGR